MSNVKTKLVKSVFENMGIDYPVDDFMKALSNAQKEDKKADNKKKLEKAKTISTYYFSTIPEELRSDSSEEMIATDTSTQVLGQS
jgi:hypothetical protein